jgi:hypothetical protein
MTPTYDQMLLGATTWKFRHLGIPVAMTHHGHRTGDEYDGASSHPGIWCYYLIISEQMFPYRWQDFACIRNDSGFELPGPAWDHDWFDTEITWSSSEPYFDRKKGRLFDASKVGCDYAHLYHAERWYPDTYDSVKRDAELTARKFIDANPDRRVQSDWSGKWGTPDQFYTAINGRLVHVDDEIDGELGLWAPAVSGGITQ